MFEKAIRDLEASNLLVGKATSFQEYVSSQNIKAARTAQYISVNTFSELDEDLKAAKCMVFRLGSPLGQKNTHFALAKCKSGWSDYFLMDEDLFGDERMEIFTPEVSNESLIAYKLFPTLTESSLVNLAMASGLLPRALGIATKSEQLIPVTGKSSFTFRFQPISNCEALLNHSQGQVEIDALFVGERNGRECLFVVEAKDGTQLGSLAKFKLLYPILAVEKDIPSNMEIVPVYLRTVRQEGYIDFNIAECSIPRDDEIFGAVDELVPRNIRRYRLLGF